MQTKCNRIIILLPNKFFLLIETSYNIVKKIKIIVGMRLTHVFTIRVYGVYYIKKNVGICDLCL